MFLYLFGRQGENRALNGLISYQSQMKTIIFIIKITAVECTWVLFVHYVHKMCI